MVRRSKGSRYTPPRKPKTDLTRQESSNRSSGAFKVGEFPLAPQHTRFDPDVDDLSSFLGLVEKAPLDFALLAAVVSSEMSLRAGMGMPDQSCISASVMVRNVLALLGIHSAVQTVVANVTTKKDGIKSQGWQEGNGPGYDPGDAMFRGHTILVVPPLGRFCDPTISQFRDGTRPFIGRLPEGLDRLPEAEMVVDQNPDRIVSYMVKTSWNDRWADHQYRPSIDPDGEAGSWLMARHVASFALDLLFQVRGSELADLPFPPIVSAAATLSDADGDLELVQDTDELGEPRWEHSGTGESLILEELTGLDLKLVPYYQIT